MTNPTDTPPADVVGPGTVWFAGASRFVAVAPELVVVHGDFLGPVLDRLDAQLDELGITTGRARIAARLVHLLRELDEGVTVDIEAVYARHRYMPTLERVLELIDEKLLNVNFTAAAIAAAIGRTR